MRAKLQYFQYWLLLIITLIVGANSLVASHISGMNVSYECLGGNEYLVSVNLFRDCYEIQELPSSINVFIASSCTTIGFEAFSQVSLQEVSQLCEAQLPFSTCNGGSQPGVQLGLYQKVLQLDPCADWRIIVAEQNRDESIANLQSPELTNVHVEALLNNASGECNNSPALSVVNLPYVCVASPLFYNLGFIDLDGDSLVYSLVPALASVTPLAPFELNYAGAYSGAEPIEGITIDPITGQIEVTPNLLGKYNAVVEVEEYRNGIRIGVVRYDFLFLVNVCAIPPPEPVLGSFENISGGAYSLSESTIGICANDDFCFTLDFVSVDSEVNVELTSNITEIIPGATETQIGTNPATIQFCGTIPPGFNGGQFLITALDDACPVYGQAYYAMEFVFRQALEVHGDVVLCEGETANVFAENDTLYHWFDGNGDLLELGTEVSCNPCQSNQIIADTSAWYYAEGLYENSSCSNRDSIFIEVPLDMNIAVFDETCVGDDGQINIDILSGSGDYLIEWDDIGSGPLIRTALVEGEYSVLIRDNVYGCEKNLAFEIEQMVMPTAYAGENQEVCGLEASLLAVPSSGISEWTAINGGLFSNTSVENPSVSVPSQGLYEFVWSENSGGGCLDRDTVRVYFYELPEVAILASDTVCGLQADFMGSSLYGGFVWDSVLDLFISNDTLPYVSIESASYGTFEVNLNAQNGVCYESTSHEITFIEAPVTTVLEDFSVCSILAEIEGDESVGTGVWNLPIEVTTTDFVSANAIALQASDYGSYNLIRMSEHLNFCFDSDTVAVRFVEQPVVELGPDQVVCSNELTNAFEFPVGSLTWNLSPNLNPIDVVASPVNFEGTYGDHIAILHANNGYGCMDSDTLNMTFIEQPIASAVEPDTICGLFASLTAMDVAEVNYWVSESDVLISDNLNAQIDIEVAQEGNFVFNWILENGGVCRDTTQFPFTFYNQPLADAGVDQQTCGLTVNLEANTSFGTSLWSTVEGVNIDFPSNPQTSVTADWYGLYQFELTETNGICLSKDTTTIAFHSTPQIQNEIWTCTGADAMYTLQFDLAYGDSSNYNVAGLGGAMDNFVFTSFELSSDTPVQVFLTDQGMCGGDSLSGALTCPVITSAGQMLADTIWVCTNDVATANSFVMPQLDLNDTILYALHTGATNQLGEVMAWNDEPEFQHSTAYPYETTFYISAVVGNASSNGVDLSDPYLSVSTGSPVIFKEEPFAQISESMMVCPNESTFIPVELTGTGYLNLTYSVNGEIQTVISNQDSLTIPILSDGTYSLVSIQSDYCIGETFGEVEISYFELPTAGIAGPSEVCFGDTATLAFTLSGEGPFDFDLQNDGWTIVSFNAVQSQIAFETTTGGVFQLIQVTDQNCSQADTVSHYLEIKALPDVDAGLDANICSGDTLVVGTIPIEGQTYEWSPNDGLLDLDSARVHFSTISESSFGESQTLVLTAQLGACIQSDSVIVTVYAEPNASIEGGSEVCRGDSIFLAGSGGEALWLPTSLFSNSDELSTFFIGENDTTIQLVVTSPFGCKAQVEHNIEVLPAPLSIIEATQLEGCVPFEVNLHTSLPQEGEAYIWWLNGEIVSKEENIHLYFDSVGTFEIQLLVTGDNGCSVLQNLEVPIGAYSTFALFEYDDFDLSVSNNQVEFTNLSPFNVQSHWTIDTLAAVSMRNLNFTFPNNLGASYEVCLEVIDPHGCADSYCEEIAIRDNFHVFVPNSFTPNGDGINDEFYPKFTYSEVQSYHFWIVDSKGNIIFDTYDIDRRWDGQSYYGSGNSENNVYIWNLEVKPNSVMDAQSYSGHVTLLR